MPFGRIMRSGLKEGGEGERERERKKKITSGRRIFDRSRGELRNEIKMERSRNENLEKSVGRT